MRTEMLESSLAIPWWRLWAVVLGSFSILSPCQSFSKEPLLTTRFGQAAGKRSRLANVKQASTAEIQCDSSMGNLVRIRTSEDEDESFLGAMAVPTFSAASAVLNDVDIPKVPRKALGLEGALNQGPAFVLHDVLTKEACENIIRSCEEVGFGSYNAGRNHHGAMQIVVSQQVADAVAKVLSRHVDMEQVEACHHEMVAMGRKKEEESSDVSFVYSGLNRRWRVYRYAPGGKETFSPHVDAGFPPSGLTDDGTMLLWDASSGNDVVGRLTVLLYLTDDFSGGETKFYQPYVENEHDAQVIASVKPVAGSVLVFPQAVGEEAHEYARHHWPLHEGSPVRSGRHKYVIRSDIIFTKEENPQPVDDPLSRYDHMVCNAFLPQSPALDQKFLHHLSSLYNPHMGVENLGLFLYSFIRFTKVRRLVEIGAGYTSVWILQALKDNDDEMERIRNLQRQGQCRLLDWPWAVPEVVEQYDVIPASLVCIDNCLHQKETATGAMAVAKSLGLDSYMKFLQGDAFEMRLEDEVDVLWCDFGVGTRMAEFVRQAWATIRPGGFLLCHSTLTNKNTRDWLEAARAREGEEITGMPPDEYVEISLLESHKHYQNSVSLFQKRKGPNGQVYEEPLHSEYA